MSSGNRPVSEQTTVQKVEGKVNPAPLIVANLQGCAHPLTDWQVQGDSYNLLGDRFPRPALYGLAKPDITDFAVGCKEPVIGLRMLHRPSRPPARILHGHVVFLAPG